MAETVKYYKCYKYQVGGGPTVVVCDKNDYGATTWEKACLEAAEWKRLSK